MQSLIIKMCPDVQQAVAEGHVYTDDNFTAVKLEHVVVVRDGTIENKPTVDFVMSDDKGNKYVFMITGALLKSIPCGA